MPLFGPRLDSPSAIGDDGRPRATSLTVASLVVGGLAAAVGHLGGFLQIVLAVAATTGFFTLGLAFLNRERFIALFLGELCFFLAGSALVALVVTLLLLAPSYGLLLGGFALAFVGMSATWANVGTRDSTTMALFQSLLALVSMIFWLVVVVAVVGVTWGFLVLLRPGTGPTASLLTVLLTAAVTALFVYLGLRWLPYEQLTPRRVRSTVRTWIGRIRLAIGVIGALSVIGLVAGVVATLAGSFGSVYAAVPVLATVFELLAAPPVVFGALGIGLLFAFAGVVALFARRATRPVDASSNRLLAAFLAGLALVLLFVPFVARRSLLPALITVNPIAAVLLLLSSPLLLIGTGALLVLGVRLGVVPDRAGGPALAATGLVVATVGAGLAGAATPLAFACAAGGLLVWDVSSFGLGVTEELGHLPETRRVELVHAVVGVGLSVVVVAVASGLFIVRESLVGGVGNVSAVALAVVGVLLLLIPIRG